MIIRLFCDAGMSTMMLVRRMKEAAKKKGDEDTIEAYPFSMLSERAEGADVVFLGPQVAYAIEEAETLCKPLNIPCEVINTADYAAADGYAVLKEAYRIAKNK